jgi:integrase
MNANFNGHYTDITKVEITDTFVRALQPAASTRITYDGEIRGFGVRITPAGAKAFVLNYYINGHERRYTIGRWPELTALAARNEALDLRNAIRKGIDPMVERIRSRSIPTLAEFTEDFLTKHAATKAANTYRDFKRLINVIINPRLGRLSIDGIRRADVEQVHRDLAGTPIQANRVVGLLHLILAKAQEWQYIAPEAANPAYRIKRYPEEERTRWAQEDELARLLKVLDAEPDQTLANAARLILLTGSRKTETLSSTWDQFDLDRGVWTKPRTSTKQKRPHIVPLNEPALELLRAMKASSSGPFLFPDKNGGYRKRLDKFWARIMAAAGIQDFRTHDLRHTFASHLVSGGTSLKIVGELLGHRHAHTTQRYAHVADSALRSASAQFGDIFQKTKPKKGQS